MKRILSLILAVALSLATCFTAFAEEPTQEELLAQYYAALEKQQGNQKDVKKQIATIKAQIEAVKSDINKVTDAFGDNFDIPPAVTEILQQYAKQIVELDKQLTALQGKGGNASVIINKRTCIYPNVLYKSDRIMVPYKAICRNEGYGFFYVLLPADNKGMPSVATISMLGNGNKILDTWSADVRQVPVTGPNSYSVGSIGVYPAKKYKNLLKTFVLQ